MSTDEWHDLADRELAGERDLRPMLEAEPHRWRAALVEIKAELQDTLTHERARYAAMSVECWPDQKGRWYGYLAGYHERRAETVDAMRAVDGRLRLAKALLRGWRP